MSERAAADKKSRALTVFSGRRSLSKGHEYGRLLMTCPAFFCFFLGEAIALHAPHPCGPCPELSASWQDAKKRAERSSP